MERALSCSSGGTENHEDKNRVIIERALSTTSKVSSVEELSASECCWWFDLYSYDNVIAKGLCKMAQGMYFEVLLNVQSISFMPINSFSFF